VVNRDEERARFLRSLRSSRSAAFRSEVVPYFRYVVQSGFGLVASAIAFSLLIGYAQLLRDVPAAFPAGVAGVSAIALAAIAAPLRTYLRPADPVFLLAMESSVLREYIRPALRLSLRAGVLRTLAVYMIFLPLYIRAPLMQAASSGRSLWLLGICLAALGAWNAYGGWRERQMVYRSHSFALRAARYAVTLLSVGGLLLGSPLPAFVLSVLAAAALMLCWRLPERYALPWAQLITEEESIRRAWNRFLGWFVDVPSEDAKPSRRRWAAWAGGLIPWDRRWAWHYLYAKTLARGDTFGALLRWYAVIAVITLVMANPVADWAAFAIGFLVAGVQLTELGSHRWAPSAAALPIPVEGRRPAAAFVARIAGAAAVLLLWGWTAIPQGWPLSGLSLTALAAGLFWQGWLIPRRIAKPRHEEDD
jgi:ABC-2 type transport system permease protein